MEEDRLSQVISYTSFFLSVPLMIYYGLSVEGYNILVLDVLLLFGLNYNRRPRLKAKNYFYALAWSGVCIPIMLARAYLTASWMMVSPLIFWLSYSFKKLSLALLVASAEERFRLAVAKASYKYLFRYLDPLVGVTASYSVATLIWTLYHFLTRPYMVDYALWLYAGGLLLSLAMHKGGLSSAIIAHAVVDMV